MTSGDPLIRVARVVKPHGLDGEVWLEMLGGPAERLTPGLPVLVDGRRLEVEAAAPGGRGVLCRLSDVNSAAAAARLQGSYLEVEPALLRDLPEGEYFDFQLVGLRVVDELGNECGELVEVEAYPAHDVYLLRLRDGEVRVPAVAEVVSIDLGQGTIQVPSNYLGGWVDAV
ncbi:MAG: ribosome maturation factor RimM [Candidatus Dormibacteraeota bacterium]|nr:ribosome maturation factor RimM [Candidatus Dormibacteraeota bacterium]